MSLRLNNWQQWNPNFQKLDTHLRIIRNRNKKYNSFLKINNKNDITTFKLFIRFEYLHDKLNFFESK